MTEARSGALNDVGTDGRESLTYNECMGARFFSAEGFSYAIIAGFLEVDERAVSRHVSGECSHADETAAVEPQQISPEEIKRRRLAEGLRQRDLAEMVGVSETTIANWENGRRTPSRMNAKVLHRELPEADGGEDDV